MEKAKLAFLAALTVMVSVFGFAAIDPALAAPLGQCGEKNCGYFRTTCPPDYRCVENRFFGGWCAKDVIGCAATIKAVCGNGKCETGETYLTCSDCPKPVNYYYYGAATNESFCGNGKCETGESYLTCSDCPKPVNYYYGTKVCGNGKCEVGETYLTCSDCPKPVNYYSGAKNNVTICGNGKCETGETYLTCSDCPKPSGYYYSVKPGRSICGNNVCETGLGGENYKNCPGDCLPRKKGR